MRRDPRHQEATANLDNRRRLVMDDSTDRARREHEAIGALRGYAGTAQTIAANAGSVGDGITRARNDEHLSKIRPRFDVSRLLDEIGAHATARLAEPLCDVQNTDLGLRAESVTRKLRTAEVEPEGRRSV